MLEEIAEVVMGPWALAAVVVLAMPGGRKMIRTVAKEIAKAGMTVGEGVKDLAAEIKEEASDVVAEVKAERKHAGKTHKAHE
jgi:hypothetical protein